MVDVLKWLFGTTAILATLIYALLTGVTLSMIVTAVAWVSIRPLAGMTMITLAGISFYLLMFMDWDRKLGPGLIEHTSHH